MIDKRNATASWSGYLHQGEVGVLVSLTEIYKLLNNNSTLNNYSIKYENAEDFDIVNNTGSVWLPKVHVRKVAIFREFSNLIFSLAKAGELSLKVLIIDSGETLCLYISFAIWVFSPKPRKGKLWSRKFNKYIFLQLLYSMMFSA